MRIDTVLFDADGVLQRPRATRRDAWQGVLDTQRDLDGFIAAVFEAEDLALTGHVDFLRLLSGVLARWDCQGTMRDALATWTMIEPDGAITDIVSALRRGGLRCCLATNQEPFRATHMSEALGYAQLFDLEFYSCQMGMAKAAVAYFSAILSELDVRASNVLFLDDRQVNVNAAREVGMYAAVFEVDSGPAALLHTMRSFGIEASSGCSRRRPM
jgi:putative hydrolase of the HAD superfamily